MTLRRINPYKLFHGSFIPEWLEERPIKEISLGAKLIYARLTRYAGKKGECFPKLKEISKKTGICITQVKVYLSELKKIKLIESVRIGKKCANRYFFREHPWMTEAMYVKSDGRDTDSHTKSDGRDPGSPMDGRDPGSPQKENQVKESLFLRREKEKIKKRENKMTVHIKSLLKDECRYLPEEAKITDHHLVCHVEATDNLKTDKGEFRMCENHFQKLTHIKKFSILKKTYHVIGG